MGMDTIRKEKGRSMATVWRDSLESGERKEERKEGRTGRWEEGRVTRKKEKKRLWLYSNTILNCKHISMLLHTEEQVSQIRRNDGVKRKRNKKEYV